ncbi:hypothetical protein BHQ33_24320 [Shigella sp. FC2125]|nr:hypothetical protein BHQ33_24320 [Shigella sp. FC2125]
MPRDGSAGAPFGEPAEAPLQPDRLGDDGRDGAIEEVEQIRQKQQKQHAPGVGSLGGRLR